MRRYTDVHCDELEIVGDMLPTDEERAELNAYYDRLDAQDRARARDLSAANVMETIVDHGFGFGF
jgi:hypothetical protein